MLEQLLALCTVCRTATVDVREWLRLSAAFRVMREVTVRRVSELGGAPFPDTQFLASG